MNNIEVPRNVILDLLPLYLAGEASADTAALVDDFLKTDPELAKLAERMANPRLPEVPVRTSTEAAMAAYIKANERLLYRTLGLSALIVVVIVSIMALVMAIISGGFV
jgi:anti-sigma factor RsiW